MPNTLAGFVRGPLQDSSAASPDQEGNKFETRELKEAKRELRERKRRREEGKKHNKKERKNEEREEEAKQNHSMTGEPKIGTQSQSVRRG